jgi:hypothetical protein
VPASVFNSILAARESAQKYLFSIEQIQANWRRGWDSNPRYGYPYAAFRVRCFQPLSHLSARPRRMQNPAKPGGTYRSGPEETRREDIHLSSRGGRGRRASLRARRVRGRLWMPLTRLFRSAQKPTSPRAAGRGKEGPVRNPSRINRRQRDCRRRSASFRPAGGATRRRSATCARTACRRRGGRRS